MLNNQSLIIKTTENDQEAKPPHGGFASKSLTLAILLFIFSFLFFPFSASAGVIRKPPNNLGLVAYWNFDEGNGLIAGDTSGNNRNGTLTRSSIIYDYPSWVSGKRGKSLDFSSIAESTRVAITGLNITSTHTVSAWIYLSSACTTWGALFANDSLDGLYCQWHRGASHISYFYASADHFNNTAISLNKWHHIAVVDNSGSATFYLDGVADGTVAEFAPGYAANVIGNDTTFEKLHGRIDELRVYNRALSASEIAYLYQSGATKIGLSNSSPGTLANGLTGYWTFDGKDMVSNVADVSGNGRNGYLINFTSTTTSIGQVGQALAFNNTDKYVKTTGYIWSNFITASDGTISVWLRPKGASPNCDSGNWFACDFAVASPSALMGFGIARGNNTTLGADKIWATNSVTSWSDIQAVGVTYNVNEWVHVTWVHTGGVLYVYRNGDLAGSTSSGNTNAGVLSSNVWIGRGYNGNSENPWNGDIDEVRTYNRALSASEIKQVYNLGAQKVGKTSTPTGSLQTGLVGHWTFDGKDMYSNVADVSGNGNNGTLTNFTSTTTVIGKIGQALNFDGVDDNVKIPLASSPKPGIGSYSVSFWYKGRSDIGEYFIKQGNCLSNLKPCWSITEMGVNFSMDSLPSRIANTDFTLPLDNEWHHVVIVLNRIPSPDTLVAYVDGTATGTQSINSLDGDNLTPTTGNTLIGGLSGVTVMRQGPMDDVRIYNRVLTASEVKQLYNLGK